VKGSFFPPLHHDQRRRGEESSKEDESPNGLFSKLTKIYQTSFRKQTGKIINHAQRRGGTEETAIPPSSHE